MSTHVTPQYLLEGAAYALEQCGLLLRDATLLYRSGSYATAVVSAAFAREELGRWEILLDHRREAISSKRITLAEIVGRCGDHVRKQSEGMLSTTMRDDRDSGEGKLLTAHMTAEPGSKEWKAADDALKKIDRKKQKRTPQERHERREAALYVDPVSIERWNRPSTEISQSFARDFICDARNDYSNQFDRYSNLEIMKIVDADLGNELSRWAQRPRLAYPEVIA